MCRVRSSTSIIYTRHHLQTTNNRKTTTTQWHRQDHAALLAANVSAKENESQGAATIQWPEPPMNHYCSNELVHFLLYNRPSDRPARIGKLLGEYVGQSVRRRSDCERARQSWNETCFSRKPVLIFVALFFALCCAAALFPFVPPRLYFVFKSPPRSVSVYPSSSTN